MVDWEIHLRIQWRFSIGEKSRFSNPSEITASEEWILREGNWSKSNHLKCHRFRTMIEISNEFFLSKRNEGESIDWFRWCDYALLHKYRNVIWILRKWLAPYHLVPCQIVSLRESQIERGMRPTVSSSDNFDWDVPNRERFRQRSSKLRQHRPTDDQPDDITIYTFVCFLCSIGRWIGVYAKRFTSTNSE